MTAHGAKQWHGKLLQYVYLVTCHSPLFCDYKAMITLKWIKDAEIDDREILIKQHAHIIK